MISQQGETAASKFSEEEYHHGRKQQEQIEIQEQPQNNIPRGAFTNESLETHNMSNDFREQYLEAKCQKLAEENEKLKQSTNTLTRSLRDTRAGHLL
jgi:hypothetical protein